MTQKKKEEKNGSGLGTMDRKKVERPKKYQVVMYNDDYTPMEFVVYLLRTIFNIELFQQTDDFAIAKYENQIFQLHADTTYHNNPLPSLLPENGARGAGVEIRLYNSNPDVAEEIARKYNYNILQSCTNKPHGLRECYILDNDGYCWIPSSQQD